MGDDGPGAGHAAVSLADWRATLDTNLTSAFLVCEISDSGHAPNSGHGSTDFHLELSSARRSGMPGMAAYAASKAGMIGLSQVRWRQNWRQIASRVNALLPGGTDTPMGRTVANTPEAMAHVAGLHALKTTLPTPEEIARSALYLASDDSSFTTGASPHGRWRVVR